MSIYSKEKELFLERWDNVTTSFVSKPLLGNEKLHTPIQKTQQSNCHSFVSLQKNDTEKDEIQIDIVDLFQKKYVWSVQAMSQQNNGHSNENGNPTSKSPLLCWKLLSLL